jgi:hypothetical protein
MLHTEASDADGTITKVTFDQNNTKIGEATVQPYEFTVTGLTVGNYMFTAALEE